MATLVRAPASTDQQVVRNPAALAVLSLAQFLIALDYSVIYIALPSITRDLHLGAPVAQWVISAYALLFAGFLMVGGHLADRVGARRLIIVAITFFGVASAVGGAARDGSLLLVARGAQGLGAALLQPAVLRLIATIFPPGPSRSRALAVWGSVGASGLAAGALLGGVLTTASWRLTFFINIPLTVLCALVAARRISADRARRSETNRASHIPVLASVLGTTAVLALVLGLTFSVDQGWDAAPTRMALSLALLLVLGFLLNENRSSGVLVERALRRIHSLRIGLAATALYMASVGSEFYLVTLLLQSAKRYTPLQAGLGFLPLAVMVTFGSATAGRAIRRLHAPTVLIGGFAIAVIGLTWLLLALDGDSYVVDLLPGLIISGFGHGVIYTSMFVIGMGDVPPEHQGAAGALLTTSQYLSGAVTVAILTLVLGAAPNDDGFRGAFAVTTAAAGAGMILIAVQRRRLATVPRQ